MTNKPTFIIGGERRSGSTTLYKMMLEHPQINMYPVADMDYFIKNELFASREWYIDKDIDVDWETTHTLDEYLSKFDGLFEENKIVGQKDADLLFWKPAHARLKQYLPEAKFVFVLRNPVTRADSQYWNEVAKGREILSFTEALSEEEQRSEKSDYGRLHLNYKERGRYIESIQHFRKFFSDDQILIVILEKLKNNPIDELKKIGDFLGISVEGFQDSQNTHSNHQDILQIKKQYQGRWIEKLIKFNDRIAEGIIVRLSKDKDVKDRYRKMFKSFGKESVRQKKKKDQKLMAELQSYYEKSNAELEEYLGYSLDEWK